MMPRPLVVIFQKDSRFAEYNAQNFKRRSRKQTDIGFVGVEPHSYRTTVNASTCAIRETSYRLDLCKVEVSKLLSVGGNNCDTNENTSCGSKTIGLNELIDSTATSGCTIPKRFTIRCMQRLKLVATISEAHRHRNPRREIAFLPCDCVTREKQNT